MPYRDELSVKREIVMSINNMIDKYVNQGISFTDLSKHLRKDSALTNLMNDLKGKNSNLRNPGIEFFNSNLEYKNKVRQYLNEVIKDRIAFEKDKSIQNFESFTKNEPNDIMKPKNFKDYLHINEIKLPVMRLDEILDDIGNAGNTHKKVIATFFKTYVDYIDLVDNKKHHFKINDMSGDIMGNNRVTFDAIIFKNNEIQSIENNIIKYALGEFYSQIPDTLNIFDIQLKPMSFINKTDLMEVFKNMLTFEQTINIITNITGFNYDGEMGDFFIWSKK